MKSPNRDASVVQRAALRVFWEGREVEPRDDKIDFFFLFFSGSVFFFFFVRVCVSLLWWPPLFLFVLVS